MRSTRLAAVAVAVLLSVTGCHKRKPTPAVALPPLPSPPPPRTVSVNVPAPATPAIPEPLPPAVAVLEDANRAFLEGKYDVAARGFDTFARSNPASGRRDEALFYLGLTYLMKSAGSAEWKRATTTFKQLIEEYPNSAYRASANLIMTLRTELERASSDIRERDQKLKQLTTELDRLKKIDADRRRR